MKYELVNGSKRGELNFITKKDVIDSGVYYDKKNKSIVSEGEYSLLFSTSQIGNVKKVDRNYLKFLTTIPETNLDSIIKNYI